MADHNCPKCGWRKKYDARPRSLLGRLWRFHIRFCPGWKSYMKSLPDDERDALKQRYNIVTDKY